MLTSMKRVLIATDLSATDDRLLSFVNQLSSQMKIEKLYLAHIIPNMLIPAHAGLEFHKMFNPAYPVDEKVKDHLSGKFSKLFTSSDFDVDYEIVEGSASQKLLELVELKAIDLLVVGKKTESEGSGVTAKRMIRKAPCDVLFVPDTLPETINHIVVPIDFSEYSASALKTALALKQKQTKVTALHSIRMIKSNYYTGIAFNESFISALIKTAEDYFDEFNQKNKIDPNQFDEEIIVGEHDNISKQLREFMARKNADLVVMGARGHSLFENFLMGSVTESFIDNFNHCPVLIIR